MTRVRSALAAASLALAAVLSGCGDPGPSGPDGEIWQWALGRSVWEDADLQRYTGDLGRRWDWRTDVAVQSEGFSLTPDASGRVYAVTLYNDENRLGFPGSSSNFTAYRGALPAGLSWQDTSDSLAARYGLVNPSGGWGIEYRYTFGTGDGYSVEISLAARHADDLAASPIHSIKVVRG